MYCLEGNDEWTQLDPQDIWVYNKLQLSALLGYQCGPEERPYLPRDFILSVQ